MHWRRKWQPTPVFSPGESQGLGSLVGESMGLRRVGHNRSDLVAAAAAELQNLCLLSAKYWLDEQMQCQGHEEHVFWLDSQ